MKKLLFTLMLILPLYGCIPAALVLGASAGGAIIYDKRSFKTMQADQRAASKAQYAINHNKAIQEHAHISLAVFDKIGLIAGQAETANVRDQAYLAMTHVKNIKRVYNAITIAKPTSKLRRGKDAYITSKVRTAFLTTGGLKSNDVKVVTENSVVYLLGQISRQQADLATKAARHVSGVAKVVKVFEYT